METFPGGKGRLGKRAGGLDKTNTWGGGFRTLDSRTTSWYPSQQSRCNNDAYQPAVIPDDHWPWRRVSKFRPTHLRIMKDRTIVKAGEEKNMAVQSPSGILSWIIFKVKMLSWEHLETASNIVRRRNPPRIPWATTLHLSFRWFQGGPKICNKKNTWWPSQGCPLCFAQRDTQGEAWSPAGEWLVVLQPFSGHLTSGVSIIFKNRVFYKAWFKGFEFFIVWPFAVFHKMQVVFYKSAHFMYLWSINSVFAKCDLQSSKILK